MKKWRQRLLVFGIFVTLSLAVISVFRFIMNDQLNTEAKAGNLPAMQTLLRQGAGVEGWSIHFKTPLMSAAEGGSGVAVSFLLAQGADMNAHNDSRSVLMWAATSGNVGVIRLLIASGADVNWHSATDNTALQTANEYKQPAIAKMLQLAGARN